MVTSALTHPHESWPIVLQFKPLVTFDDEQFFKFCQLNQDWQFERTAAGELLIMSPTGSETGGYNFDPDLVAPSSAQCQSARPSFSEQPSLRNNRYR